MTLQTTEPVLECVPNFSEGTNDKTIKAIADAIRQVPGQTLLHIDSSPAANRTVMTFAGQPEAVAAAAFRAVKKAAELIDMSSQKGVHPRIGATDVCPLVPLANMTMEAAAAIAQKLGKRIGDELGIPVYLYEHSQKLEHRRALPHIRKGQYEGFAEKMRQPGWQPDYGPRDFVPRAGVTVLGARGLLVAFNISLDTQDEQLAQRIASRLRSSGYAEQKGTEKIRRKGLLEACRAIGWYMADYQQAQVSFNLLDYRLSSPLAAFEACQLMAEEEGARLTGSELIGMMPEECLLEAGSFSFLQKEQPVPDAKNLLLEEGVRHLKLDQLKPFVIPEKILEIALSRVEG